MRTCSARVWAALLALVILPMPVSALAHSVDAASLSLTEISAGRFLVRFQASSPALQADLQSPAVFPSGCQLAGKYLDCGPAGLAGTIEFPWLDGSLTRVMVDIEWLDHTRLLRMTTASAPRLAVYGSPAQGQLRFLGPIIVDYTLLGIEHILTGWDHLLFVISLTLLVRGRRALLATVTAFTVAHSLSLATTVLGVVTLPSAPVEASIALSIVLVCAECLRPDDSLSKRAPWLVAFAFGLLHGLGLASALLAIGLPQAHVPIALLFFNIGVEFGQLTIIAGVAALVALAKSIGLRQAWLRTGAVYAMGTVAAGWSLDRLAAVIGR
jgi:hydrogenase/urease accessory protein HupE